MDRPTRSRIPRLSICAKCRLTFPRIRRPSGFWEGKAYYQQRGAMTWPSRPGSRRWISNARPCPKQAGRCFDLLDLEARVEEAAPPGHAHLSGRAANGATIRRSWSLTRFDIDKVARLAVPVEPLPADIPRTFPGLDRRPRPDSRQPSRGGYRGSQDRLAMASRFAEAWDGWLWGWMTATKPELLRKEFARLPEALAADPRFASTQSPWRKELPRLAGCRSGLPPRLRN